MITTINEFKNILESTDTMNSDKEVKLKHYRDLISTYNSKKGSFRSILNKSQETWEDDAQKIIDGNTYLGSQWKLDKIDHYIKQDEERMRGEVTQEEKKEIQEKINDNKKKLSEHKNELSEKIREDLNDINRL